MRSKKMRVIKTQRVIRQGLLPPTRRHPKAQDLVALADLRGVTPAQFAEIAKRANFDRRTIEIILEGL